jgi:hypothetical protein
MPITMGMKALFLRRNGGMAAVASKDGCTRGSPFDRLKASTSA